MSTVYNDPIMLDSTGQDIVTKLDSIVSLMGDGVIDDTSTTATDKTWSANKENTVVNGLQSNVIANTKLIKDTVGWSGKNIADDSKSEIGIAWNGGANSARARLIIPVEPNSSYIFSVSGTNNLDGIFYGRSASIPCAEIYAIQTNPYTINTGANDNYLTLGFNKNNITLNDIQLLKLMLRDANILDDTYEPHFGSTAFPRSEQAVLGAKNMCCITGIADKSSNTDVTWSVNSARVKSDVAAQYINTNLYIKSLPKNKTVKISLDVTISAGGGIVVVRGKPSAGSFEILLNNPIASTGSYEFEFNTGSNVDYQLNLYASRGTASAGDVTYNNIMISFDGGEYVPHAMTNEQLTVNKIGKDLIAISSGSDLDDIKETGWYQILTAPTHSPESKAYSVLEVFNYQGLVVQRFTRAYEGLMYVRTFSDNAWRSWYKFTGTAVS